MLEAYVEVGPRSEINRAALRTRMDGTILQRNIRAGEYIAVSFPGATPPFVLGEVSQVYVRVDIDEYDISRLRPEAVAKAYL